MGHTWREMDPEGAAAHDQYFKRLHALREKLSDVPLSEFTVGELESVMRLMGLCYNTAGRCTMNDSDFKKLERKKFGNKKKE